MAVELTDEAELSERVSVLVEKGKLESAKTLLEIALHKRGTEAPAGLGNRLGAKLYEPYVPPPFVIEGVLAQAKVCELVAYGGSAKTWIAIFAGIDVALGHPWMGRFPTTQGRALYLDWENGSDEMRRRVQMYLRGKGYEGTVEAFDVLTMPGVYMDSDAFEELLAKEVEGHALCIIDTLKAASPNVDENSSAIRVGLDKLKRVAERTSCAFIIIVHSKKSSPDGKEGDPREAARGSSAIFDAADTAMQIRYRPGEPSLIRSTKSRNGKAFEPFVFELRDTEDGGILIETGSPKSEESRRAEWSGDRQDAIVAFVKENPGASNNAILKALKDQDLGVNRGKLPTLLNSLAINGAIRNQGTDKNPAWHFCSRGVVSERWDTFDDEGFDSDE